MYLAERVALFQVGSGSSTVIDADRFFDTDLAATPCRRLTASIGHRYLKWFKVLTVRACACVVTAMVG